MIAWDAQAVQRRLDEAARTLRASPASDSRFLHVRGSFWPESPSQRSAYGYSRASARPAPPDREAIERMNEVIAWMATSFGPDAIPRGMPRDTGKILWRRAEGKSWQRIMHERKRRYGCAKPDGGNSRSSLNRIYTEGLEYLAEWLCRTGRPVNLP